LLGLCDIGGGDADEPQAVGARFLVAAVDLVSASNDAGDDGSVVVPDADDGYCMGFSSDRLREHAGARQRQRCG
jgi:hypothetical protein